MIILQNNQNSRCNKITILYFEETTLELVSHDPKTHVNSNIKRKKIFCISAFIRGSIADYLFAVA